MPYPTVSTIIDREQQFRQVLDAFAGTGGKNIFEWYGIAGLGKSRVLNEVKKLCRERDTCFVVIDFLAFSPEGIASDYINFLLLLCDQLDHTVDDVSGLRAILSPCLRTHLSKKETKATCNTVDISTVLPEFCARLRRTLSTIDSKLVLLFDSTERCSEELFNWLGADFLPQLIGETADFGFLIFLAGRGPRAHYWPINLRNKLISCRLDPLAFNHSTEHIQQLSPDVTYTEISRKIYEISNGHPYTVEALVEMLRAEKIEASKFDEEREHLAQALFHEVIRKHVLGEAPDWVTPFLEVACIPRRFEPKMLADLLLQYQPELIPKTLVPQRVFEYISHLQTSPLFLIQIGDGNPAYELDITLRKLLHAICAVINPEQTLDIHKCALKIWEETLADNILRRSSIAPAIRESIYHTTQIALIDQLDVIEAVLSKLRELLNKYFVQPLNDHDELEIQILKSFIENDEELKEISEVNKFVELIDGFLKKPTIAEYCRLGVDYLPPNEYRISWYKPDQATVPVENIATARRFPLGMWREEPRQIGATAFKTYLPKRAQDFLIHHKDAIIQLCTDWNDIPWELMYDGNEFLCLQHAISRQPQTLKEAIYNASPPSSRHRQALIVGNPNGDLPASEHEVQNLTELLEQNHVHVDLLLKENATANNFVVKLANGEYTLIHFAGHGWFDLNKPHLSGLRFANDELYFAEEFERGILKCQPFIFLNACTVGLTRTEQSTMGFRGKFAEGVAISALMGGAKGCLCPMWEIGDQAANEFAFAFYSNFLDGVAIGESVRRARLSVRNKSTDLWASWVLYGHPLQCLA